MAEKNDEQLAAFNKAWSKVVAKAWSDPDFRQRLLKEPNEVLKENGIDRPQGLEYRINEASDKIVYLNLPKKPSPELEEEALKKIRAGYDLTTPTEHIIAQFGKNMEF